MAEQLICNQQVVGSTPITSSSSMGEFPSGQRGQTVNLLSSTSLVRIQLPPPYKKYQVLTAWYFLYVVKPGRSAGAQHCCAVYRRHIPKVRLMAFAVSCAQRYANRLNIISGTLFAVFPLSAISVFPVAKSLSFGILLLQPSRHNLFTKYSSSIVDFTVFLVYNIY